jgi:hypothetical protein
MLEGVDPPLEAEHLADLTLGPVRIEPRPAVVAAPCPQLAPQLLHRRLVERHAIDVADVEAAGLQAEGKGRHRQARVVLDAREALLLGRRHQPAVLQQATGRLVVERRDADDVHGAPLYSSGHDGW